MQKHHERFEMLGIFYSRLRGGTCKRFFSPFPRGVFFFPHVEERLSQPRGPGLAAREPRPFRGPRAKLESAREFARF